MAFSYARGTSVAVYVCSARVGSFPSPLLPALPTLRGYSQIGTRTALGHSAPLISELTLLDPRDPLLHSERTQGFAADPDYWKGEVFAYVGSIQNLKD